MVIYYYLRKCDPRFSTTNFIAKKDYKFEPKRLFITFMFVMKREIFSFV